VEQIPAELVLGVSEGAATEIPENWLMSFIRGTGTGSWNSRTCLMAIRDKRKARNQKASRFSFTPETILNDRPSA